MLWSHSRHPHGSSPSYSSPEAAFVKELPLEVQAWWASLRAVSFETLIYTTGCLTTGSPFSALLGASEVHSTEPDEPSLLDQVRGVERTRSVGIDQERRGAVESGWEMAQCWDFFGPGQGQQL
ncbi:hypothetical protein P7K49_012618 [Saguinus oedipus]|uniref:Uncharacterized protein n=1 Tax=Saguinus oedipus TaxID=9490 RepID=A0ABQ9VFN6_SAGOE|nr:hypothetical protein P7K49_012618 [Saguinus oedipus]